ncbi:PIN2/TERF1-interacting telomerase inhibitor 1 [Mortierella hygrophila]|uniref:PIN2/TERF1-interacting telomerase inhibitor 1 n=1 Tax=Mortierella hygrophila TaxID=979708 RepID=A0A9P6FG41_9FUNG|nr:PIN2/TERF1-interacting telomerase inhibitor 1 [Mortierella hygrophila]
MSLKAVRHAKQRLAPDPRNLHWANDTSKFGFKMMEKMGWSQGKGLGAKEDGVQEHVKVRLKENQLGVGATKKSSDNWLGNTDAFSRLLADLNERVEQDSKDNSADNSKENSDDEDNKDASSDSDSKKEKKSKKESKEKKSKKESKEKKSKKEGKEKKEKKDKKDKKEKKSKKSSKENDDDRTSIMAAINGRKASRHKYLRNKHAALQNSERLNEILGIKSETASPATSGMSTPVLEEPMTSTDIFAARMQQNNISNTAAKNDDEPARPMFGGLGFATSSGIGSTGYNGSGLRGLGFVKATVSVMPSTIETKVEETVIVESTPAPVASSVELSASEESAKEDKKSKKESKEKKEKKEKKRKSEDSDNSRSKKSKK